MQHDYSYDGLYRLVQAQGSYTGADNKTAAYSLQMGYDNLHNIVSKNQQVSQQGIMIEGGLKAGYDLSYTYDSTKKNQIKTVQDINYREEESKEEEKRQEHKNYHYDLNGNLTYVNVELEKKDLRKTSQTQERKLRWDEENRLMSIDDNGYVSNYVYDATGERVIKTSGESEQVYINSLFSGGNTETQGFTAYINPYLVVSPNGKYTKHYYAGSQRIVSKLGDIESFGADPRRIEYAGSTVPGVTINWKAKYQRSIEDLKGNYAYFEVPYNGKDNDDYVNGEGFCCSQNTALRAGIGIGNVNYEKMQYYYHPDHLGSSSYISNLDGEIVQHVEYVPFGEVFIEERNNSWNTPYLFNGKELDEETGLYYYGARYYNPRESIFLSVDPMFEKTMTPYQYAYQNPIRFIDFDGRMAIDHIDVEKNEDGTYTVVGGQANSDKNIYVVDKQGKRTGEVLGQMFTEYSFHREDGSAVTGTNINLNDKSGQNFFNNEIKNIGLFEYIGNAKGKEPLDFKHRGMNDKDEGTTVSQHHYRGMLFEGKIASARDIGNFAAGYVAGVHGFGWKISRFAFDALQTKQEKGAWKTFWLYPFNRVNEGQPTQRAEKAGHNMGYPIFKERQFEREWQKATNPYPIGPKW